MIVRCELCDMVQTPSLFPLVANLLMLKATLSIKPLRFDPTSLVQVLAAYSVQILFTSL